MRVSRHTCVEAQPRIQHLPPCCTAWEERIEPDSRPRHFDQTVAFFKGGDTSVRNMRLLSNDKNLRKGAKWPRLRDVL
jgi:hypothetical protein